MVSVWLNLANILQFDKIEKVLGIFWEFMQNLPKFWAYFCQRLCYWAIFLFHDHVLSKWSCRLIRIMIFSSNAIANRICILLNKYLSTCSTRSTTMRFQLEFTIQIASLVATQKFYHSNILHTTCTNKSSLYLLLFR